MYIACARRPKLECGVDIVVSPQALSAEVEGATVILAPDMKYLRLDGTGSEIWRLVQAGDDLPSILDALCARYDVDRETAQRDVMVFLRDLAEKGILSLQQ